MSLNQKDRSTAGVRYKRSREFADDLWRKWPTPEQWPSALSLYEAAAYKRIGYKTLWRACQVSARDGKARLAHQRFGTDYRISKAALDRFGLVEGR